MGLLRVQDGSALLATDRAALIDILLRTIVKAVLNGTPTPPTFTLVATGGYGRGLLNPRSDSDWDDWAVAR